MSDMSGRRLRTWMAPLAMLSVVLIAAIGVAVQQERHRLAELSEKQGQVLATVYETLGLIESAQARIKSHEFDIERLEEQAAEDPADDGKDEIRQRRDAIVQDEELIATMRRRYDDEVKSLDEISAEISRIGGR